MKNDLISRQQAIVAIEQHKTAVLEGHKWDEGIEYGYAAAHRHLVDIIEQLPSAQPTLYGYNIEHLELIARVLQKEDLPPERVAEALINIGEIVAIVSDEFEETLRKAVEQCTT